ncbi:hypothetical protein AgCh_025933 [Apium graveolens]
MGDEKTKGDDISSEDDSKTAKTVTESQPPPQIYPYPPSYQGYPPPCPGYPNSNYHEYGPAPPPPPGYYQTTARNFVLIGPPQRSNGYKYARLFLTLMIIIFFGMSIMSLLTWFIYGSDIPVFYAQSLNMTVFSFDDMGLNASWSANVSIKNTSHKDDVQYDYVEAALVYEDHILDTNYANPFVLGKTQSWDVNFGFLMPNAKQNNVTGAAWEKDIENERRDSGSITFDMRIIVNAAFTRNGHHTTSRTLRIFCADLEVVFASPTDTHGKLNEQYKQCIIVSN